MTSASCCAAARDATAAFPRDAAGRPVCKARKMAENEETLEKRAQEALAQIVARDYDAEFRARGVEDVLHYGVAFLGKRVHVELAS